MKKRAACAYLASANGLIGSAGCVGKGGARKAGGGHAADRSANQTHQP